MATDYDPVAQKELDKMAAQRNPSSVNATRYNAAQAGEYSYETREYTGATNSTNGRILGGRNATSQSNTVQFPKGRPNATWTHEQLSAYYKWAREHLDPEGMNDAWTMSNYIWDISGHPENKTDASRDIAAMSAITGETATQNPGSWIGGTNRNPQKTLANKLYSYQTGAYDGTSQEDYYNYVRGLSTDSGLLNENGTTTDLYRDNLTARQGYYTNEGNNQTYTKSGSNNRKGYSYNADSDPLWQAYLDRYKQESNRAARNTIGEVAANTGGLASSYATTAANQAANYYTQQANDAFMDIYQQKYNEYLNQLEQQNYQNEQAYNRQYNQQQLALSQQQAAQNQASTLWEQQYNEALLAAEYGDYSKLRAMGVDMSTYEAAQKANTNTGSYSGGGNGSKSVSGGDNNQPSNDTAEIQSIIEKATASAGYVSSRDDWDKLVAYFAEEGGANYLMNNGYRPSVIGH